MYSVGNTRRIDIHLKGFTNGYHLIDLDKDDIEEITLTMDGMTYLNWDEDDIDMYCVECPNSVYIPFNTQVYDYDIQT